MLRTSAERINCDTLRRFTTLSWSYNAGVYSAYVTKDLGETVMSALNGQNVVPGIEPASGGRFKLTITAAEAENIPTMDMNQRVQQKG